MFSEARLFLKTGVWQVQTKRLTPRESFFIHGLRVILLSIKRFRANQCSLRASALTFYTLLSIVPALALVIGVAKGFGLQQALEKKLLQIPSHELVMVQIVEFARNMLLQTQGGVIAGIGVMFLLWTVLKVLEHIEKSFNDIWEVERGRSWARRFSDYFSLIFVCPLLLIPASGINVFIGSQVQTLTERSRFFQLLNPVFAIPLYFLPHLMLWALLTFLYIFMPNTRVRFSSALLGAFVASTLYQLVQWAYFFFQINVAQFNAVYGSFAAFPLFIVWLQISWIAVLYGSEVAYAKQYAYVYEMEPEGRLASHRFKSIVALLIASRCAKRFVARKEPPSSEELAEELELPVCLVQSVLQLMVEARVLALVYGTRSDEARYQPGSPVESMTVKSVLETVDHAGVDSLSAFEIPELERCRELVENFWGRLSSAPENLNVKDVPPVPHDETSAIHFEKQVINPIVNAS
jgi:membrane protein